MLPTKEELLTMPITSLESALYPQTPEEEKLLQEVLDQKRSKLPPKQDIYRGDIPFRIETPEQEAAAQKIIDERMAKLRPQAQVETPVEPEIAPTVEEESKVEEQPVVEAKTRFCEFCDSKGFRHKLSCTRPREAKV